MAIPSPTKARLHGCWTLPSRETGRPSPPLPANKIYGNFTAKIQEVLEVGTSTTVDIVVTQARLGVVLADRIAQIARLTNTTADLLTGSVRLEPPTDTDTANSNPNPNRRRRLSTSTGTGTGTIIDPWTTTTVDESTCNGTLSRIYLDIDFTSEDPAEQARFIQAFEALANDVGTEPIDDVDGAGSIAYVCVP